MFEKAVKRIVRELIKDEYSHINIPPSAYGVITKKKTVSGGFEYNIALTDARGTLLNSPIIPMVKSVLELEINSSVVLTFVDGKTENAYILGEILL